MLLSMLAWPFTDLKSPLQFLAGGDVIDLFSGFSVPSRQCFMPSDYVRTDGQFLTVTIDGRANEREFRLSIAEFLVGRPRMRSGSWVD